jgi:hypothetical protein
MFMDIHISLLTLIGIIGLAAIIGRAAIDAFED